MKKTKIQVVAIDRLQLNKGQLKWLPRNPRQWTQTDIDKMARSLERDPDFVEERPVLATPGKGDALVVFAHNLLTEAASRAGQTALPAVIYTPENEDDRETIRRRALLDNGAMGRNDTDILANEWPYTAEELVDFGYEDYTGKTTPATEQAQEDDFDETADEVETRCKAGDIWQLGNHRLMCGDSTDAAQVALLMNGEKADLVFTDPPYGNGDSGKYGRGQLGIRTILGDEDLRVLNSFISIMECNKIVYFLQWRTLAESLQAIQRKGLKINTVAVWDKKNAGLNGGGGIAEQWEAIIFAGDIQYRKFGGNVFSISREQHKRSESPHPHQKPITLLAEVLDFIDGAKTILDPFGGSGSTLITAEQLGRRCFMMELDPHYCDVILARWEKLTGQTATKIN